MPLADYLKAHPKKIEIPLNNKEGKNINYPGKGNSLRDTLKDISDTAYASSTNTARTEKASVEVSSLLANIILKDNNMTVSVYDGEATELVENYERFHSLQQEKEDKTVSIRNEINNLENSISTKIEDMSVRMKAEASSEYNAATKNLSNLQADILSKIEIDTEAINEEIQATKDSYQKAYEETLADIERGAREIRSIMDDINTSPVSMKVTTDYGMLEIDELVALAKEDAELIKTLRSTKGSIEEFQKMAAIRENRVQSSIVLASAVTFAPATLGYAALNLTKKFLDITTGKKYIKMLQEEIQAIFKVVIDQINEIKLSYCIPDTSELEEALKGVKFKVESSYKSSIEEAEREVEASRRAMDEKLKEIPAKLKTKEKELQEEARAYREQGEEILRNLEEECCSYKETWEEQRAEFEKGQVLKDPDDRTMHKLLEELCPSTFVGRKRLVNPTVIDQYRMYNELEVLNGLSYHDKPASDLEVDVKQYVYDQELLELRDQLKHKTDELTAEGRTKEFLENEVEHLKRELDKYYAPKFKGLHSGFHILHQNVIDAIGGSQELYMNDMDNKSILFIYDKSKEGDEEYLASYIKYQVQQLLANYHPDSMKVNIINPGLGYVFNSLQVSLDEIDEETKKLKVGRDYSKTFNSAESINKLYKMQMDQVERFFTSEDAKYDSEDNVYRKRKKGAVTPQYNVNVLYNVGIDTPFKIFDKAAAYTGIINIYLMEKSNFISYDNDSKSYKLEESSLPLLQNVGAIGESVFKDNTRAIYITDIAKKQISRFIYKERSWEEEDRVASIIRDKALSVKKPVVVTEEFLNSVLNGKGYWKEDATKFVKLYFGYVDGDESKPYPVVLDEDDSVHMFIGGTTGGGKSNLLAVMMNCLKMMYSPSQLDVVYFDFKVVEVAVHAKPYKMPHCSAMSGTSAAEYLISLFSFCDKEMMRRYNLFKKWNVVKLSNLIKKMRKEVERLREEGKEEEAKALDLSIPRRMIIVVDEAAQAFQLDDDRAVERITLTLKRLAQLARAAGVHMILVSQDPNKMPQEVLTLLKWRGCTKADDSVSKAILHESDIASRPENQFIGFFATSNGKGEGMKTKYVVPLNEEADTRRYSKIAYEMAKEDINRDAVTFDEDEVYTKELFDVYVKQEEDAGRKVFTGTNILLGEPVYFCRKFKPHEIRLQPSEKQNVAVMSADDDLRETFFKTVFNCLDHDSDFMPVYCKVPPKYAPLKLFTDKVTRDGTEDSFLMFIGKNVMEEEEIQAIDGKYGDFTVDQFMSGDLRSVKEQEAITEQFEEDNKKFIAELEKKEEEWNKEHPDDPFVRPPIREDGNYEGAPENIDIEAEECFFTALERLIAKRRKEKITKPLYIMMFDLENYHAVIDGDFDWRMFASLIDDANIVNIHLILFGADAEKVYTRNIFRYFVVGKLSEDVTEKQLRNINIKYCKAVNTLKPEDSALFKPILYHTEKQSG